jgi:hypothetical protein
MAVIVHISQHITMLESVSLYGLFLTENKVRISLKRSFPLRQEFI